ncbi:hypothetical protein [Nocardia farcinica]|uniref:hypothetical protein n=1 Tax=Nocardia farcinica TaxID=37329 RepID=UPI00189588EE|nr:hypothetical protein [Nocardia farcinica]MBF6522818.1 hypothetical protein [Nocardia farcinica]
MAENPDTYYVWHRRPDGYVAATCYPPKEREGATFEILHITQDWLEARDRIRAEQAAA